VRAFITYSLYRLLAVSIGRLPPRWGYPLAEYAGHLLCEFSARDRGVIADNLRHVLGPNASESEIQSKVRQACVHIVKGHYDLFRVARLGNAEIEDMVDVTGWQHLKQAMDGGQGVIVLSAHLGNVELVMQGTVIRGIPAVSPVERIEPERLFQYTRAMRQSHGLRLIPADGSMVGLFRALKRGEIVGLAGDRDVTGSGRIVDFFGSPARLPDGPVRVALRTGAPLIPAFAHRRPDNTVEVHVEPPLQLVRTGDKEADIQKGMEMMVAVMEQYIARWPEQWLVAQRIWSA
jgi:KDO2-lipid IV(A) lauroyltransferase